MLYILSYGAGLATIFVCCDKRQCNNATAFFGFLDTTVYKYKKCLPLGWSFDPIFRGILTDHILLALERFQIVATVVACAQLYCSVLSPGPGTWPALRSTATCWSIPSSPASSASSGPSSPPTTTATSPSTPSLVGTTCPAPPSLVGTGTSGLLLRPW